jgi:molybdopterin-containing oxidoreductase family molybdopterin binding subunit
MSVTDDVWVPSACNLCYNQCGILVHRVDGVVVKIEGNPDNPMGMGRLCPRGLAGIQLLYDPHRVNYPLKRTNPEKGLGKDPGWQRISWDEALDTISEKLRQIRRNDPRKLLCCLSPVLITPITFGPFYGAFGTRQLFISNGHHCGNAEHILARTLYASTTVNPDLQHCDYVMLFGVQMGFASYYALSTMAQRMGDAHIRGMRVTVADPFLSPAAEKADTWLPLKPGSDGALALAMLNLLLNEYGLYDREYLAGHTDAPYLVAPDGDYLRDPGSGKPMIWDLASGCTRTFDDEELQQPAIEGTHTVNEQPCRPVLELLKERVAPWTPEAAAEATTLPPDLIRRVAREFGEAARIGSTITIDGRELPLRPVAAVYFKGANGHDNAWGTALAIDLLNEVVGANNTPGGLLGCNPVAFGYPETGALKWAPWANEDGLLACDVMAANMLAPWPAEPQSPTLYNLADMIGWPLTTCMTPLVAAERDRWQLGYEPEMLINYGSNLLWSVANSEISEKAFKDCFVVSFNIFLDESAEALSDIVLPDTCYLERLEPMLSFMYRHHFPVGMGEWSCMVRQPIVPPAYERRSASEVMLDLARRVGVEADTNTYMNFLFALKPPYSLDRETSYTMEEIADRVYKCWFGPDRGLAYIREHGVIKWPKQVDEVYWRSGVKARVPLYYPWVPRYAEKVAAIAAEKGIDDLDTSVFVPLPDWRPCQALRPRDGYDLQAIYYRVPWHTFSFTYENPWLDEVSRVEPYSYFISINTQTAKRKGLHDGDLVWVESADAGRIQGRLRLTEGVHPDVIAVANNGGHKAMGMPIARGRGVHFNDLLAFDLQHTDMVSLSIECDARVKVYRA